jgi:hypothetical protein
MAEAVKVHFNRTLQVAPYEPCNFGVEYLTEVRPDETPAQAHTRAQETLAAMFNEVQSDVISQFGLRKQIGLGKSSPVPPPPNKK